MKILKQLSLVIVTVLSMTFTSCEETQDAEFLYGSWALVGDAPAMILRFDESYMYVKNGQSRPPFDMCDTWNYYINKHGQLVIEEYVDPEISYVYELSLTVDEDQDAIEIVYDPTLGKTRKYRLIRRT